MAGVTYSATGKRKTSIARVRLLPGSGVHHRQRQHVDAYFGRQTLSVMVRSPLLETGTEASLRRGGQAGGWGQVRPGRRPAHGIARALVEADPSLRTDVKRAGYLSRDARMVERKKAGLKKARKRPQFSKR